MKVKSPTLLKIASLISHDIILEIFFLKQNDLLIDSMIHMIISRKELFSIIEKDHFVKIDNALM